MKRYLMTLILGGGLIYGSSWNYLDHGPDQWGKLDQEWKMCQVGKEQSPINIQTKKVLVNAGHLNFSYELASDNIINNGHTLQINFNKGNFVEWNGDKFNLLQFHLHTPAENKIDDKGFPLEIHFVHQDEQGKLLVVSVLFEKGEANPILQSIIDVLPLQEMKKDKLQIKVNPFQTTGFYNFNGSLTTPPCSENVQWIVMEHTLQASEKQITALHKVLGDNARNLQNLGHRKIYESQ